MFNNTNRPAEQLLNGNGNRAGWGDVVGVIEDHQVPDLRMLTMRSPPDHQRGGHGIMPTPQHQPTPLPAGVTSRIVVTPSPLNASEHTYTQSNNGQLQLQQQQLLLLQQTQQSQSPMDDHKGARRRGTKNPLQLGLESVAAFFGLHLDEENGNNRDGDVHAVGRPIDGLSPKEATECNTGRTAVVLSTTTLPDVSTSSIKAVSHRGCAPTSSRPIPLPARRGESFHEANHRRHSAPTDVTLSSSDNSSSELECKISPSPNGSVNGNGTPQDFYDLKDGHLWRAKYCVLDNGILFFYRNANDGECAEASMERKRSTIHCANTDAASEPSPVTAHGGAANGTTSRSAATTADDSISRRRSSAQDLSKSPMPVPILHHLDSTGSSGSSMWEKRVFMDCVGGVRTAEQQYGPNSFELIALDDDDFDQSHINTLVLRASSPPEMKEWIFQFHRSLASFMRNIMDVFGSTSTSGAFLDIHHPASMQLAGAEPRISKSSSGLLTPGGIPQSPSEKQLQRLYAVSPRFHHSHHGASHLLPTQHTLSHGHGRTSLKRRIDIKKNDMGATSVSSTPEPADTDAAQQQFAFFDASPDNRSLSPEVIIPPLRFLIPPPSNGSMTPKSSSHKTSDNLDSTISQTPTNPLESKLKERSTETSQSMPPKRSTGKYIPPHLRNKSGGAPKSKYVPPHLRRQQEQISADNLSVEPVRNGNVATNVISTVIAGDLVNSPLSIAENADFAPTTPPRDRSFGHGTADQLDVVETTTINFVRGGCADPQLIQGSIMDRKYIPKKASRVGQAAAQPFGSYGGGRPFSTSSTTASPNPPSLRWEAGAVSECGVRECNEDAYLITNDLLLAFEEGSYGEQMAWKQEDTKHSLGIFAVFDGHLGNQAARFAVENLAHFIHNQLQLEGNNNGSERSGDKGDSPLSPSRVEHVLREAMIKMDDRFCQLCQEDGREWESGATALVAMIANEHLVIANLGDCRGVLCRFVEDMDSYETDESWSELTTIAEDQLSSERTTDSGDAIATQRCFWKEVTTVHTPSAEAERLRIEEANGWIRTDIEIPMAQLRRMDFSDEDVIRILQRCFNYFEYNNDTPSTEGERSVKECKAAPQRILDISRVCGELAVSRALGDRDFKAAFNSLSTNDMSDCGVIDESESDERWWDSPLFLPYPDNHNRRFKGDLVSNTPDFQRIKIGDERVTGEFLLLACDGLWDVMDYDDAVRVARDLLFRKKWTAKKSAVRLAELAMHLGSSDNVTVVLIRLFSAVTPDGR
jgi:serine/threonine protein phosphatase PrpC